jgi:hypothetical protein
MRKTRFILMFAVMVLLVLCMSPGIGRAVGPPKDSFYVAADNSVNNIEPHSTVVGTSAKWIYAYEWSCTSLIPDTLKVKFRIENTDPPSGECYDIGFTQSGAGDVLATLPATAVQVCDDNTWTNPPIEIPISIPSPPLAPGDYIQNISITTPPGALTENNPKDLQVKVHVDTCNETPVRTCFFTNSEGMFLSDCSGAYVSINEGGTFILNNKKNGLIVATNPGQFYYNFLWTNPGDAVDVEVQLDELLNLVPHGANAVHAYTFNTGFTQDLDAFEMVNNNGTPCGPNGPCTINVGVGETLWVTWHLEYEWIGYSKPGAGFTCPGLEEIKAGAHLIDADSKEPIEGAGDCITTATGYNKK